MSDNVLARAVINLEARTTQLETDLDKAKRVMRDFGQQTKAQAGEAKASLALLSEELGIHIPRHLRSFIVELPGVGAALSAAFSSVAVIALIEVVIKAYEKIAEWKKKLEEAHAAWDKFGDAAKDALHKQDEVLLSLKVRIEELTGKHVQAFQDKLKEINEQSLDKLGEEFKKLGKAADDAFQKMQVGWFLTHIAGQGNDEGVANVQQRFKNVLEEANKYKDAGDAKSAGAVIQEEKSKVEDIISTFEKWGTGNKYILDANKQELSVLNTLLQTYKEITKERDDKKDIATIEERTKALAREQKQLTELLNAEAQFLRGRNPTQLEHMYRSSAPLDALGNVNGAYDKFIPYKADGPQLHDFDKWNVYGLSQKLGTGPDTNPLYTGSKHDLAMQQITTNKEAAIAAANQVRDSIQSVNDKWSEQWDLLVKLYNQGLLNDTEFTKGMQQVQAGLTKTNENWAKFGEHVGKTIDQAILMGRSWQEALKSIVVNLAEVILKMTLLKSLTASGGGGGGFFGSLLTGLLGGVPKHADGGTIPAGGFGIAGEAGPELLYGGSSGVSVYPLSSGSAAGGSVTVNYYTDARGADPSILNRLPLALKQTENNAVVRATAILKDSFRRSI